MPFTVRNATRNDASEAIRKGMIILLSIRWRMLIYRAAHIYQDQTFSFPERASGLSFVVTRCRRRFLSARGVLPSLVHANMKSRKYLQTISNFQANNGASQLAVYDPHKAERQLIGHGWSLRYSDISAAIECCFEQHYSVYLAFQGGNLILYR
jgi:hypothetical protein